MTQEQLVEIFEQVIDNLRDKDFSSDEFMKRLKKISDENGKIELTEAMGFMLGESKSYSELLVFDLFNKLRVLGAITLPNSTDDNLGK